MLMPQFCWGLDFTENLSRSYQTSQFDKHWTRTAVTDLSSISFTVFAHKCLWSLLHRSPVVSSSHRTDILWKFRNNLQSSCTLRVSNTQQQKKKNVNNWAAWWRIARINSKKAMTCVCQNIWRRSSPRIKHRGRRWEPVSTGFPFADVPRIIQTNSGMLMSRMFSLHY